MFTVLKIGGETLTRGGKREGAGAKPRAGTNSKNHSFRYTDEEWNYVLEKAKLGGISASDYVRKKSLEGYKQQ